MFLVCPKLDEMDEVGLDHEDHIRPRSLNKYSLVISSVRTKLRFGEKFASAEFF